MNPKSPTLEGRRSLVPKVQPARRSPQPLQKGAEREELAIPTLEQDWHLAGSWSSEPALTCASSVGGAGAVGQPRPEAQLQGLRSHQSVPRAQVGGPAPGLGECL